MITSTALSTEAYHIEQESGEIPSLMLRPCGDDKSTTKRNLSELLFGTRPIGLLCTNDEIDAGKGPTSRPDCTSDEK